jgi:1-acyl-sn-glycerol-3-phosphate acyltransferase
MAAPLYETGPRRRGADTGIDPFGYDPVFHRQVRPILEFLYRRYFRVHTEGIEHLPASGPVLVVSNHSGGIPFDAAMLATAIELEHPQPRLLRFLYDRFAAEMPFVGTAYNRFGAVVASYANAETLLARGEAVGIFPEGIAGIGKGIGRRYRLQSFRTGFVRLSLTRRVPIVPAVVVGAEEIYPVIGKLNPNALLRELLNVPYVPVTPFFPLLGPLGAIPLPTRWLIRFAPPLHPYRDPVRASDRRAVHRLTETVRRQMQGLLHQLLAQRSSLF